MDRDEFMELVYETFAEEPDNVLANGIIEAADAYVEHEKAQLFKEDATSDLISRQAAIDALNKQIQQCRKALGSLSLSDVDKHAVEVKMASLRAYRKMLENLPTIQPEVLACGNGELVAKPEPTDIDAKEAVYNLAEKIGIHQLFALTVELRGEPIQPELTDEQVLDYCKKRCLYIVTSDVFQSTHLTHKVSFGDKDHVWIDGKQYISLPRFQEAVKEAQPKEGHWIEVAGELMCSECRTIYSDLYPDYDNAVACPHCGARMTTSTK